MYKDRGGICTGISQEGTHSGFSLLRKKERETMKNPFSPRNIVSIIAVAMITLVTLTNFAHAEAPGKGAERKSHLRERVRADILNPQSSGKNDQIPYSQDELEQTRSALLELAGAVRDLTELAPGSSDTGQLDDATKQISELSYQQLAVMRKALNPSRMNERLTAARAVIADYKGTVQNQSTGHKPKKGGLAPASEPFPSRDPFCSNGQFTAVTLASVDLVYFAAETARDIAKDACLETLIVLGEGGNTSLACVITDSIYIVAHAVWEAAHFCNEEFTDATVDANYERLEHIHGDLEASVTNDNTNKTTIVNNDNSNKTMIIAEIDAKATAISSQIDSGTTNILNKIESKGNDIINNDNTNRTQIINNANTNTSNIITNDNANKTMIINNENANLATTINELRALGCDIIRLLNTPDGQRSSNIASCQGKPGWPYSWNKSTSAPVVTASLVTSDATGSFSNQRGQDGVPILPLVGTVTMERNLLESRLIPTYYLPANRGGMIEQVKKLVWNTIEAQLELNSARNEKTMAKTAAQQADELLAKKKYLEAYRQYCLAYQQLIPTN